jgi:glycerate 2-kinase
VTRAFHAATFLRHPAGPAAASALEAALAAADPSRAVQSVLEGEGTDLSIAGQRCGPGRRVVIAIGKAAIAMAEPVVRRLGGAVEGLVVSKMAGSVPGLPAVASGHPLPDDESVAAGRRIGALVDGLREGDTAIVLVSGGASSLAVDPAPGIDLEDLRATIAALLRDGADIEEVNVVRRHLDRWKGGGLAARAAPARTIALVLSDVPGDRLHTIASGPTVGDPSTFADALAVLLRHGVDAPARVVARLRDGAAGRIPETPRPGDPRLQGASTTIVASNASATEAARRSLQRDGYATTEDVAALSGEASEAGRALAERLLSLPADRPCAIVAGGETVVHVRGPGHGGRNQELALAAAEVLAGHHGHLLCTLATDGEDGPTDAAGAVVDGRSIARAEALGRSARAHLEHNDAYPWFHGLGDLLRIGPTGTNVCDLALAVHDPRVSS